MMVGGDYRGDSAAANCRSQKANSYFPTITLTIDGKPGQPVRVENPLGPAGYFDGVVKGTFFGRIPTEDATRSQHVVYLNVRPRGGRLCGTVSAVAMNRMFILPSWIELERASE